MRHMRYNGVGHASTVCQLLSAQVRTGLAGLGLVSVRLGVCEQVLRVV